MQIFSLALLLQSCIYASLSQSIQLNVGIILEGKNASQEKAFLKGVQEANQKLAELRSHEQVQIKIHPIPVHIDEGNAFAASLAACDLIAQQVIAIFGPDSRVASTPARWISQQYSIPYLIAQWDWNSGGPLLNYTVNLHPPFEDVGDALVDFLNKAEEWNELGVIYAHDDSLVKYKNLFSKFNGKLIVRKWDKTDMTHKYTIKYFMTTQSLSRFVVDIPRAEIEGFLQLVAEYNMTNQYYSYIFTDWDTQFLDIKTLVVDKGANFSAISLLPLLGLNYEMPDEGYNTDSQSVAISPNRGETHYSARNSLTYYFLISDALKVLSVGISRLAKETNIEPPFGLSCKAPGIWPLGRQLLSAIKSVKGDDVEGSTGTVEFGSDGRRKNVNIKFLEMGKDGFLDYGYWNDKDKLVVTKEFSKTKEEIQKELKGQTLRVVTTEEIPFMMYRGPEGEEKSADPKDWQGFCIDLLNECASALKFNYTIHPVSDGNYGTTTMVNGHEVWDGIIGQLQFRVSTLEL